MQDMTKMYGMMGMGMGDLPTEETLVLNKNNTLVQYILEHKDDSTKDNDVKLFCEQLYDLAMISHKTLDPEKMSAFITRSNKILEKLI